ncbi:hypothetical protein DICPUDRAFT_57873 [Dictyostelium purpureum]|uniref:NADH:flavin oxidoreductase/NADH oxidase N-terminal domain-containing protein n=1 Tax=Dictyostelium purpureum TaxID=5786 RepID=F0ZY25_DICPU|nr:uncharacterized protein DICPUDRAFT_57873 [Dictyostelium purpureum]EGC31154.1 hypothetical protein DICPUDRAFT_57873 [Dictyostelium purpureum]|eukprot:XP_003292320.1 hypothetical protein DICPUDRAFT_57873 [Dictyostelium purpureum]
MEEFVFNHSSKPAYLKSAGELNDLTIVDETKAPKLFQKIQIKNIELKNRVVVSPMCTYSSYNNGYANDWHFSHYTSLAKGGPGLIIVEASAVVPEGRITYGDLGLWEDGQIKNLKRINDFAHQFGVKMGIQIAHSGRKGSSHPIFLDGSKNAIPPTDSRGWVVKGPSPIAWSDTMSVPLEMTTQDIKDAIEAFKQSARRSVEAGYDFLEIHSAHGYLLSSFLSPTSNKRTDEYTGSTFEGRIKLLLDIIQAVRTVWTTERPLAVRISCEEYVEGGWNMEDTVNLAKVLDTLDVDLLDCSSGGNNSKQVFKNVGPLYQVPFAHQAKQAVSKLLIGAVGIITNGKDAESVLQEEKSDLILVGRAFLKNPQLTYEFAQQLGVVISYIPQYELGNRKNRIDM